MNSQVQPIGQLTENDLKTLYEAGIIPQGTPRRQIDVFAQVCRERNLSPFSKEIYLVGYKGIYSVITGINGFRKKAAETGEYAGQDDVKFNLKSDGTYQTAFELQGKLPVSATITVYRIISGVRCPFTHTAVFSEFSTGKRKWVSMPFQMISKVAEAFAIRKGFSGQVAGLSIPEEVGAIQDAQAETVTPEQEKDREQYLLDIEQMVAQKKTVESLFEYYQSNMAWISDHEVTQIFTDRKVQIQEA